MIFRIVGTFHGNEGRAVQHALVVRDNSDLHALACDKPYDRGRFFLVGNHSSGSAALAASGAGEITCAECRAAVERDYVFNPDRPRTLVGQYALTLREKSELELDDLLSRVEQGSAAWSAVHLERHRRETGVEY